jgi:hypothetical protein
VDAIADLFAHQKLRTQLWFDNVTHSRSMVIAPNPDTAVGNTGHIIMDEVGRMPEFQALVEAVAPFMSSNPLFKWRMATTPPPDDTHYSYEMLAPDDPNEKFPVNARGNFYRSQAGIMIHRVDAWDACRGESSDLRPGNTRAAHTRGITRSRSRQGRVGPELRL